jgi:hypothetical protein
MIPSASATSRPPEGTTLYFEAFGVRAELLGSRWPQQYLTVGGAMVGVRFDNVATGAVARVFLTSCCALDRPGGRP